MNRAELKRRAREQLGESIFKRSWPTAVLALFIFAAIIGAASSITGVTLLLLGPLEIGIVSLFKNIKRYNSTKLDGLFDGFAKDFKTSIVLGVVANIFIFLWSLLLIVPGIVKALTASRMQGLRIPIVYNTSGYDSVDTLAMLEGLVDIYLPDFKYVSSSLSARYSHAANYFDVACKSLAEMWRQVGKPVFDGDMLTKGIIVRHLLLPGCVEDSKAVIRYLYETYGDRIFISIMNQYTPLPHVASYPELGRKVTDAEYDEVVDYAIELGVEQGFIQEGDTAEESFIPEFDFRGIL